MKIIIFGSDGMLGNYVKSYLSKKYQIVALTREEYDLSKLNIDSLKILLKNLNLEENDIIINCAGIIPQSIKNYKENTLLYFTVNSLFPVILSMISKEYKSKLIHITTDCVFSGKGEKNGNYDEDSIHDETNDYGVSKSLGELSDSTIIRTSIIGEEKKNKRSLLEWVRSNENKEIKGFVNHYWNGVTCLELSKIINEMIERNIYWKGVKHIFTPQHVSKYELVSIINEIYNLNIKINKHETKENIDKTIRTKYQIFFEIPDIHTQIKELKDYKF